MLRAFVIAHLLTAHQPKLSLASSTTAPRACWKKASAVSAEEENESQNEPEVLLNKGLESVGKVKTLLIRSVFTQKAEAALLEGHGR